MSQPVVAQDKQHAEDMLKCKLDEVILVLKKKDLDVQEKSVQIADTVRPMFDFGLMAKLTLGKKHWRGLGDEQKKTFTDLFVQRLQASYTKKLVLFNDGKIRYDATVQKKNKLQIPTWILSDSGKISIIYKFYFSKKSWRIYDIEIQGVSIVQSYHSQFDYILKNGTIDDVILKLREDPSDE